MVSKVAVIALVAIVACPILIGYAFNLNEITVTEYKTTGESVNVSQLLSDGKTYTYVNADYYKLNSSFYKMAYNGDHSASLPYYESLMDTESSMPMTRTEYPGSHPAWGGVSGLALSNWGYLYYQSDTTSGGHIIGNYCDPDGTLIMQINYLHSVYYNPLTSTIEYTYYQGGGYSSLVAGSITVPDNTYRFGLTDSGGYVSNGFAEYILLSNPGTLRYVDLSKGYHFVDNKSYIELPEKTKSYIMTINLDSITADNYSFVVVTDYSAHNLVKTTTAGVVRWYEDRGGGTIVDLYYDPSRSDNTYQLFVQYEVSYESGGYRYCNVTSELRYVGGWPTVFGGANSYIVYDKTTTTSDPISNPDLGLNYVTVRVLSSDGDTITPTVRLDEALFRAFQYNTINNKTYNPADFKTNPSTMITDINIYGKALIFAGNTYDVTDGNITLGTHQISVKNMVFESTPIAGGYVNKINGIVISTTAAPSTITFSGTWSASITTTATEQTTYTKTEWTPGQFGWDGMDHNFLIVGLLTSFGVFIALGIYIRRTKAALWPLLVVCGGAVMLFFIML